MGLRSRRRIGGCGGVWVTEHESGEGCDEPVEEEGEVGGKRDVVHIFFLKWYWLSIFNC